MDHVRIEEVEEVEEVGPVRQVIISRRQKRNALSGGVYAELGEAFTAAAMPPTCAALSFVRTAPSSPPAMTWPSWAA